MHSAVRDAFSRWKRLHPRQALQAAPDPRIRALLAQISAVLALGGARLQKAPGLALSGTRPISVQDTPFPTPLTRELGGRLLAGEAAGMALIAGFILQKVPQSGAGLLTGPRIPLQNRVVVALHALILGGSVAFPAGLMTLRADRRPRKDEIPVRALQRTLPSRDQSLPGEAGGASEGVLGLFAPFARHIALLANPGSEVGGARRALSTPPCGVGGVV